jgi:hypothetical protein
VEGWTQTAGLVIGFGGAKKKSEEIFVIGLIMSHPCCIVIYMTSTENITYERVVSAGALEHDAIMAEGLARRVIEGEAWMTQMALDQIASLRRNADLLERAIARVNELNA